MKIAPSSIKLVATLIVFTLSVPALAWGERGHDLVTRAAVQHLRTITDDDVKVVTPFVQRDHMLAHLSNVPDIVWRASYMSDVDRAANVSTHFINMEQVYQSVAEWNDLPLLYSDYARDAEAKGLKASDVGTGPWRALQLYRMMVSALSNAGTAGSPEELEDAVNQALLYAGLMSHFVGDLANPHHTTENYDGQLTGQNGLHAYFESHVVAALPLGLALEVQQQAGEPWITDYSDAQTADILSDAQKLIWALSTNSHRHLPRLLELDKTHSLLEPPVDEQSDANRKPPLAVAEDFKPFVVERLGVGASVLAQLWLLAWQEAGSPDLSAFKSYHYPVMPDFIDPTYLTQSGVVEEGTAWRALDPQRVLVMQLERGQVVMELAPQFAPKHVENIQTLVNDGYFSDTAIIRSQENYVVQWGDPNAESERAKGLGSATEKLAVEFFRDPQAVGFKAIESRDAYAEQVGFVDGFPAASDGKQVWLAHCYGMLGVSRAMESDSGNGSGLYVVTGHAPRHLDRNVTLVGRVVSGMEYLTTLPRGTGNLGFYESPDEYITIRSLTLATDLPNDAADLEVMRTDSAAFAQHVAARTTRNEDWFLEPTGRIELCNVAVPVRRSEQR